jgi:hypothetical protein
VVVVVVLDDGVQMVQSLVTWNWMLYKQWYLEDEESQSLWLWLMLDFLVPNFL